MTTPEQQAADLADAPVSPHGAGFTAFAPRLETNWFTCERQEPVGTTVRYAVLTKDAAPIVLGEIAWSGTHHGYVFTPSAAAWRYVATCLQDLGEICTYLTARQRRRTRPREHASGDML